MNEDFFNFARLKFRNMKKVAFLIAVLIADLKDAFLMVFLSATRTLFFADLMFAIVFSFQ